MLEISVVRSGLLVNEFSLDKCKKEVKLVTNRVLKNVKGRNFIVFLLALGLIVLEIYSNHLTVPTANFDKLNSFGAQLLGIAQQFGKWIFLVMACLNVIKDAMEGANKDVILKTIVKYLVAYGCLFALPWLFTFIEQAFN